METRYELSAEADEDYVAIYRYGLENFGKEIALEYALGLDAVLKSLALEPFHHEKVDQRANFRRAVYRSHVVYYEIHADYVLIVRILGQQDVRTAFG